MRRDTLERILAALEARKLVDAAALAENARAIAALDDERAGVEATVASEVAAVAPNDLPGTKQLARWREAQRRRLERIADARAKLEAAGEPLREALLRSNGEVEAVKRLLKS